MFKVSGLPILADDISVLQELKTQLQINGISLFNEFKIGSSNIQFNCPIHNEGQEKKPSCGITTRDRASTPAGTVHCFTCGYIATIEEMISHCFGKDDNGEFGKQWLLKNFLTVDIINRKDIKLDMARHEEKEVQYISEQELDSYRYYHPYMYKRKLTDYIIEIYDIGYDKAFKLAKDNKPIKCITFPVRDETGGTLFIARRCVDFKLFHYPEDITKPVYGLFELDKQASEVVICESIINALTSVIYGKNAVALMGLGTEYQYNQLRRLPVRKYITALDGDKAGGNATIKLRKALDNKLVTTYNIPNGKDVNDLSYEEFNNLEEIFC